MHILENCLRKETYILLVIQKQTISTPRHFAAGGPLCPHKKKTKTKNKNKNKPSQPHGIFAAGGGGGKMPTQEKKNKPSHLIAGKSYLNQSVLEKLF